MELVYLWVEKYKNIHKQGFNFSPRFRCEYDEEKNELKIVDKDKTGEFYPKNFFGDNLNITAVVGENGSGKSSISGELFSVIKQEELRNFEYYIIYSIKIIKDDKQKREIREKQYLNIRKFLEKNKLEISLPQNIDELSEENFLEIEAICIKNEEKFVFKKTNFIYIFYINKRLVRVSNLELKDMIKNYKTFFRMSKEYLSGFFCALGEFSTRENHKGGEIVDSIYSILPLQRKEMISSSEENIEKIIKNIGNSFFNVKINEKGQNKVIFNNKIPLGQISFGEKYRIILFHQILTRVSNPIYKNNVIFLDEVTLSLHPKWQKNFINDLILLFKGFNVHFIVSSHSPFILSDLPKENVIFLEKDEKTGNCINATNKVNINPFGANIHTLLSHGFFMKDGLMGEFAKEKINQVYNFIVQRDTNFIKTKEEAQNIINLIGEPMLRKELQFLYDEKFEVDEIDKQIREYEEAIEKLKSKKKKND